MNCGSWLSRGESCWYLHLKFFKTSEWQERLYGHFCSDFGNLSFVFDDLFECDFEVLLVSFFCCSGVAVDLGMMMVVSLIILYGVIVSMLLLICTPLVSAKRVHMKSSFVVVSVGLMYRL